MDLKRLELSTEDEKNLDHAAEVACIVFCGKTGEKQITPLNLSTVGGVSALDTLNSKNTKLNGNIRNSVQIFCFCVVYLKSFSDINVILRLKDSSIEIIIMV